MYSQKHVKLGTLDRSYRKQPRVKFISSITIEVPCTTLAIKTYDKPGYKVT